MADKTVKVKMLKTAAGPGGNFMAGHKYTMTEAQAKRFVKAEAAEIIGAVEAKKDAPKGEKE